VLDELDTLKNNYNIRFFEMVDNILDMKFFESVLPAIEKKHQDCTFFYEVKANISRLQMEKLKNAKVLWIQPGIESLHSDALKLMGKGIQTWQNLLVLRWARELGIRLSWNILWGFPGEKDKWYGSIAEWLPLIEHLQPPSGIIGMRLQRNSHYFEEAQHYNIQTIGPHSTMYYLYNLSKKDLMELSFSFSHKGWFNRFEDNPENEFNGRPGTQKLAQAISKWRKNFWQTAPPILAVKDMGDRIDVMDTRSCSTEIRYNITGITGELYLLLENAPKKKDIPNQYQAAYSKPYPSQEGNSSIEKLIEKKIVIDIDERLLSLGVPGDNPHIISSKNFPGGFLDISGTKYGASSASLWDMDEAQRRSFMGGKSSEAVI